MPARVLTRAGLTDRQALIWAEHQLAPRLPANNMVMCFAIEGELDPERFAAAFAQLVEETEVLRTVIRVEEGKERQLVLDQVEGGFTHIDLGESADPEGEFARLRDRRAVRPFDATERLYDACLVRLGVRRWVFYLGQHHVICDAWSFSLLFRRLAELYEGQPGQGPLVAFSDHRGVEREYQSSERAERARAFWKARRREPIPPLNFYGRRPPASGAAQRRIERELDPEVVRGLTALAEREALPAGAAALAQQLSFMTALYALLYRVSGNELVALGCPLANRPSRPAKRTAGVLMELCPFQVELDPEDTFETLWRKVAREYRTVLPHAQASQGNPVRNRRFDVMLNFHNARFERFGGRPVRTELRTGLSSLAPDDAQPGPAGEALVVHLHDFDGDGRLHLVLEANRGALPDDRIADHFVRLLRAFADDPSQPIAGVPLLDARERQEVLTRSGPWPEAPAPDLLERFRAWAQDDPARVALRCAEETLSYGQLDQRVRELSSALRARGIGPERRVAVCLDRSPRLVTALLAVLDAGGAYIPLDPSQPAERVATLLREARPDLVLTETCSEPSGLPAGVPGLRMDVDLRDDDAAVPPPAGPVREDQLAYVIFTSGSTGRPKGVEIERGSLNNLVGAVARRPGVSQGDCVAALGTVAFDIAVGELFPPLWAGASIDLIDAETARDALRLAEHLERSSITLLMATPATWQALLDAGWRGDPELRSVSAGEALSPELAEALLARTRELWNGYGPTETTVYAAVERVRPEHSLIGVGTAVDRTTLRVLDTARQPVPDGVVGELYIGGAGVARGYAGRPDLTSERFVADPHVPGARLYRTGDLARFLSDGRLQCLGRIDHQLKVRGFRIEAGEVESVLKQFPEVADAVVVAGGDSAHTRYLAAHLVRREGRSLDLAAIRETASRQLPSYMVPTAWAELEELPLNANRKVDRRALPEASTRPAANRRERALPANDVEVRLAALWRDVLEVPEVGRHDDFFELGGHSLRAVRMLTRVREKFGVRVELATFFDAPTLAGLGQALDGRARTSGSVVAPLKRGDGEPPLFCVAGVWLFQDFARAMRDSLPVYGVYLHRELEWVEALSRGESPELPSARELAAQYIEAIRSVRPRGPYRLAGVSNGGVLAYEIARQLREAGETVDALLLLDARLHGRMAAERGRLSELRHRLAFTLGSWLRRLALYRGEPDLARLRNLLFQQALQQYEDQLQPSDADALLCRAAAEGDAARDDPHLGWRHVLHGEITLLESPGHHLDVLRYDNVRRLRPQIDRYLDRGETHAPGRGEDAAHDTPLHGG